ncbi:hypothetical protein BT69DRAFT_1350957 [Atractiella rhizophila]|nr:hypothetical protein BT69DRAFT_1350957 [Atractiella rhizophila]
MSNTNEPSKINANYNSIVGGAKETIGNLTGYKDLEQSGAQQKRDGDAEYKAAQAQGYAEGTKDRVGGKIDNVVGAVTGDKSQEMSGSARHDKGEAQQEVNKS